MQESCCEQSWCCRCLYPGRQILSLVPNHKAVSTLPLIFTWWLTSAFRLQQPACALWKGKASLQAGSSSDTHIIHSLRSNHLTQEQSRMSVTEQAHDTMCHQPEVQVQTEILNMLLSDITYPHLDQKFRNNSRNASHLPVHFCMCGILRVDIHSPAVPIPSHSTGLPSIVPRCSSVTLRLFDN